LASAENAFQSICSFIFNALNSRLYPAFARGGYRQCTRGLPVPLPWLAGAVRGGLQSTGLAIFHNKPGAASQPGAGSKTATNQGSNYVVVCNQP
jgi:hypothetical protein